MLTWMLQTGMTPTRSFSTPTSIDTNPTSLRVDAKPNGLARHDAGYGTGTDLAPGGAD